jgi:hypothetical protein
VLGTVTGHSGKFINLGPLVLFIVEADNLPLSGGLGTLEFEVPVGTVDGLFGGFVSGWGKHNVSGTFQSVNGVQGSANNKLTVARTTTFNWDGVLGAAVVRVFGFYLNDSH